MDAGELRRGRDGAMRVIACYDRRATAASRGVLLLIAVLSALVLPSAPCAETGQAAGEAAVASSPGVPAEHLGSVGTPVEQDEATAPEGAPPTDGSGPPAEAAQDRPAEGADTPQSEDTGATVTASGREPAASADGAPISVVNRFHEVILGVMRQAKELGYEGRLARLAPAINDTFDLEYMATKVIGRNWNTLRAAEQDEWLATFAQLTRATYAGRFNRHSGERFETLGQESGAHETVIVRTTVVGGEEDINLTYRLHDTAAGWKVIDVYFKGTVSEIALRRSEYSSVLKRDGFEALVATLNRKIEDLAAEVAQ